MGLEGRAPGYPALGKEILRPFPENLGDRERKNLTSNRARVQQERVDNPGRQSRFAQSSSSPANPNFPVIQPDPITPPSGQPIKPTTHPHRLSHRRPLSSQSNGGKPTSAVRSQRREVRNSRSAVDPMGARVLRRIREFTN